MNNRQSRIVPQKSNQSSASGSTLVVSLVILLVLTIFGVIAMQAATLQERMAGNLRDRELAFQAAEAALREAEAFVQQTPFPPVNRAGYCDTRLSGSRCDPALHHRPLWARLDWSSPNASYRYGGNITGVAAQPRYIIEELPAVAGSRLFHITARAVGGTDTAVVVLQTTFRWGGAATTGRQSWRQLQ